MNLNPTTDGDIATLPPSLVLPQPQPFSAQRDYLKLLAKDDRYEEDGKTYPYLRGLRKLAHEHRGGVKSVDSKIVKVPSVATNGEKKDIPDCIAAVTVTYEFHDGTSFSGSADASYKAHKAPFNLHLVAIAESKAEARAIRRAFNIQQVAKEEMGGGEDADEQAKLDGPIADTQMGGIKTLARRNKLSKKDVLEMVGRGDLEDISELTYAEGVAAIKKLNRYKPK